MGTRGKYKVSVVLLISMLVIGLFAFFKPNLIVAESSTENNPDSVLQERLQDTLVLYVGSSQALVDNAEVQVDLHNAEVVPYVKEGRVLVPLRFIADSLQAEIAWNEQTADITLTAGEKVVQIIPGKTKLEINGQEQSLDTPAEIVNGRTFMPLRAISEAFGKKVFYDRGLIIIGEQAQPFNKETEKSLLDRVIAQVNNLPTVDSYDNLQKLLADVSGNNGYLSNSISVESQGIMGVAPLESPLEGMGRVRKSVADAAEADYSETNVQVQGVDEADIVKTDGEYIYQVNQRSKKITILKAYPAEKMEVMTTLDFAQEKYTPLEIYLHEQYLVVVGSKSLNYVLHNQDEIAEQTLRQNQSEVKVYIYDLRNKKQPSKVREVEVEGYYLSSRKIGPYLYFVSNCPTRLYYFGRENYITPLYRDTALQEDFATVPYQQIRYFCPVNKANYLVIAGLNLDQQAEEVQIATYLGAGENLYVSQENLYVALEEDGNIRNRPNMIVPEIAVPRNYERYTTVYKFSLDQGKVTYLAKGEVPGNLLNQFSMDEHQGYFRVATTTGNVWAGKENIAQNNVYVLDESMSMVGKIENIAPGERIYAARFMGERAYLVTFKDTDPFFVLDLKEPTNPTILGALKIPGYSDYLHPYDENHIIGFGKDTVEVKSSGDSTQAYYQGMKLALFDVTDVTNPRELFKEVIGDRGTDSELLRNHKALLFDREKELLAFPVKVMEIPDEAKGETAWQYGQFTFQGAYVYRINLQDGFTLQGKISHLTAIDHLKAGYYDFNTEREVKRLLYIKDVLYTLSDQMVKAHGLPQLEERNKIILP